jgi:outer membrane receptor protein involved in Fe transport
MRIKPLLSSLNIPIVLPTLISIILLSTGLELGAQSLVRGVVTVKGSSETLIGATVQIGDLGTVTNTEGAYVIENIAPGKYQIEVNYVGMNTYKEEISVPTSGSNLDYNIELVQANFLLNEATVTSSKFEKPLGELTVSLDVVKPQFIEENNAGAIDEILDRLPGVQILDGQANIRGGSGFSYGAGSRVLLLVDDIPILQADAGFPNWRDVPIENIEQVEVVKGAASALYGSSALNGIINIRTGFAKSEPSLKASVAYTSYFSPADEQKNWWKDTTVTPRKVVTNVLYKRKFGKFDLVAGLNYFDLVSYNENTSDQFGRLNFNTRYRFSDSLYVGLAGNFNAGASNSFFFWLNGEDGAYRANPSGISATNKLRFNVDPYARYIDKKGNRHKINSRIYSVRNDNLNNQSNQSLLLYGEYQYQRQLEDIDLTVTSGLVGLSTDVQAELYGDTTYSTNNLAAYLQLDKKFFDRLTIGAGVRIEQNVLKNPGFVYLFPDSVVVAPSDEREVKPVFRLGMNYQLADFTYLRASWGQGYRYPTIAEKYIFTDIGGANVIPNPDLASETGVSYEVGIKQGFRVGSINGFLDVSGFLTDYQDMLEFSLTSFIPPAFQSINVGDTRIYGSEVSVQGFGKLGDVDLSFLAGYTFIEPKFMEFDTTAGRTFSPEATQGQRNYSNSTVNYDILKYRFRHTAKADLRIGWKGFDFGVNYNYMSYMEAIDFIFEFLIVPGLTEYRMENQNDTHLWNLRLGYSFNDKGRISLIWNNVTNIEYSMRPGLLESPSSLATRIDYTF